MLLALVVGGIQIFHKLPKVFSETVSEWESSFFFGAFVTHKNKMTTLCCNNPASCVFDFSESYVTAFNFQHSLESLLREHNW